MLTLLLAVLLSAAATAPDIPLQPPDPSTGVINGRIAVTYWPAHYDKPGQPKALALSDCVTHIAPIDRPDNGSTYPCGKWFQPAAGKYKTWIEQADVISPAITFLSYSPMAGSRGLMMFAPVVPAGRVTLHPEFSLRPGEQLRLFALNTSFLGSPARFFERRVPESVPVRMPAGPVLAAIFDKNDNAIALSRPVQVATGAVAKVLPVRPARHADVVVIFVKPLTEEHAKLSIALKGVHGSRAPDVFADAQDAVFAVWYSVAGDEASVSIDSPAYSLRPTTLQLRSGQVSTFRGRLERKPHLKVRFEAREPFEKVAVRVTRPDGTVAANEVRERTARFEIDLPLDAEKYSVSASADGWLLSRDADLSDALDHEVEFIPTPIVITGNVFLGRDPVPARLTFTSTEQELASVSTDQEGAYKATFWAPGLYMARVALTGSESAPYIDPAVDIETSEVVDFHLPKVHFDVRVLDAEDGRPIRDATVTVLTGAPHPKVGSMRLGQKFLTDQDGRLSLPSSWLGTAEVSAKASGYLDSEPQLVNVTEDVRLELNFRLHAAESASMSVRFPDGVPAVGAEACIVAPVTQAIVWRGAVDGEGVLKLKNKVSGVLVIRHAHGSAARVLPLADSAVTLRAIDPSSVTVRSVNGSEQPVRFAVLTMWIDGVRLTADAVAFIGWSDFGSTDNNGIWLGRNLPAGPLMLLASRRLSPGEIATGGVDSLAQAVPFPRPDVIVVKAIE